MGADVIMAGDLHSLIIGAVLLPDAKAPTPRRG
jgi:hypothetical protein